MHNRMHLRRVLSYDYYHCWTVPLSRDFQQHLKRRIDTETGGAEVYFSPSGNIKLTLNNLYDDEEGNTYEYQGNGQLRKLTQEEIIDRLLEKYAEDDEKWLE